MAHTQRPTPEEGSASPPLPSPPRQANAPCCVNPHRPIQLASDLRARAGAQTREAEHPQIYDADQTNRGDQNHLTRRGRRRRRRRDGSSKQNRRSGTPPPQSKPTASFSAHLFTGGGDRSGGRGGARLVDLHRVRRGAASGGVGPARQRGHGGGKWSGLLSLSPPPPRLFSPLVSSPLFSLLGEEVGLAWLG